MPHKYNVNSKRTGGYAMDNRELEMLMDKYRRELIEYSKMNGGMNKADMENDGVFEQDEREKKQQAAIDGAESYERDRSDPLPAEKASEQESPEAVAVQARVQSDSDGDGQSDIRLVNADAAENIPRLLRESCETLANEPDSSEEQRRRCREINDFLAANDETGTMRVEARAADQAFGISSARVMIFMPLPSGNLTVFDGLTDISGSSVSVVLPAPPRTLSQQEDSGGKTPYAVYSVYVEHPNFVRAIFTNVPVFSGVESVQPVAMIAKAAGTREPDPIVVDQSERNSL